MSRVCRIVAFAVLTLNQTLNVRLHRVDGTVNKYAIPRVSVFVDRVIGNRVSVFGHRVSNRRVGAFGRCNGLASKAINGPYSALAALAVLKAALAAITVSTVNVPELQP